MRVGVVVAGRRHHDHPPPAWHRLRDVLEDADELVWVDTGTTASGPWPGTRHLHVPHAGRGRAYARGVQATDAALVALTDEDTLVEPGWRAAVAESLSNGAAVTGGPVVLSSAGPRRSVAGRLVDYAPHAVPPFLSAARDVSGNNVAYRREALAAAEELWKSEVDAALARAGTAPILVPGMRAECTREYGWADLLGRRLAAGRLYGAMHERPGSRGRVPRAVACAALPLLRVGRLAATCRRDPRLRRDLLRTLPEVLVSEICWSVGEAVGRVAGRGGAERVW